MSVYDLNLINESFSNRRKNGMEYQANKDFNKAKDKLENALKDCQAQIDFYKNYLSEAGKDAPEYDEIARLLKQFEAYYNKHK